MVTEQTERIMEKIYHAVPREDGGWKIIVQIIRGGEAAEEELPVQTRLHGGKAPGPLPDQGFRTGQIPPEA